MNPRIRSTLMAALGLVMLLIPVSLIYRYESVMKGGRLYKFRIAPVDPYDAFRGRYVRLGYQRTMMDFPEFMKTRSAISFARRRVAWGRLSEDAEGFAVFTEVALEPSEDGDWLKVNCNRMSGGKASVSPALDRFYMEESMAPMAEMTLRRTRRLRTDERPSAYVVIRVKGRHAAIEQLFMDGIPIAEYLKRNSP